MIIYPAIDIKDGACVRLVRGRMEDATVFGIDPAAMARRWAGEGAKWLHVVDLNGAFAGRSVNLSAIQAIVSAVDIPVQLGGGIRTLEQVSFLLGDVGVRRVVLGTVALEDPALLQQAAGRWPGAIAVAIDVRDGVVAVRGWAERTGFTALDAAKLARDSGVGTLIYTDVSRDGTMTGPNLDQARILMEQTGMDVIVSGGVRTLSDVRRARQAGAAGCILGMALYSGAIDLKEAIGEGEPC